MKQESIQNLKFSHIETHVGQTERKTALGQV